MQLSTDPKDGKQKPEPSIAMINIIFLMLIFFLIAGTLAPPLDRDLTLVDTTELEGREPPDALVILSDGSLSYRRTPTTVEDYVAEVAASQSGVGYEGIAVRVVPDRELPAARLIEVSNSLREEGAARVFVVTERSLQ